MEFVEIGRILAEKCGVALLSTASAASTRFEQATQRLFNTNELSRDSTFHRIISQTHIELPCFNNVTYPENTFGNTRIPYNVNDLVTIHESLTREYNALRVAYKSLMGICEIQLRRIDDMSIQILTMQQWFLDYVAKIREINLCNDLLPLTEQSKRIKYGKRFDEVITLMDIHHNELEVACNESPHPRPERLDRIATINATTLQAIAEVIANHINLNIGVTKSEQQYEDYFISLASVPELDKSILTIVDESPTASNYVTPTGSQDESDTRPSPRSPSNEPREKSKSPSHYMRRESKSPNGNRNASATLSHKLRRTELPKTTPTVIQQQEQNKQQAPKQKGRKKKKTARKTKAKGNQVTQPIQATTSNNKNNGSNRSRKKTTKAETDEETMQRQRLYGAITQISGNAGILTPKETTGVIAHVKATNGYTEDEENEIWFSIETGDNFQNDQWRTKARLYRETLIRESGGDPTAFENEEEYAPIWNPRTGRLIARIYKRRIVAELNTPDYQINISDAMNGMSPNEMCAIKSLIEFGRSEKQHQRAMKRAGQADRARLVLERRQLTDCVQEQLKLISPDSGSNILNAFARIQWDTSQGTSSTDKTPEDSISNCPQGSVIEGGNRMLLPEREQDFK